MEIVNVAYAILPPRVPPMHLDTSIIPYDLLTPKSAIENAIPIVQIRTTGLLP